MTLNPKLRALLTSLVPAAALILAGCEDDPGLGLVRPKLVLSPEAGATLQFDEVVVGRSVVDPRVIQIGNDGDGNLNVEDVIVDGVGAAHFRVSSRPRVLLPGQRGEIFVRFEPTAVGIHEAQVVIRTNDQTSPEAKLGLYGPAREPCAITAGPSRQSFLLGEIKKVTISAVTTHECEVNRLFTDRALFEILNEPELPFTIPAGGSYDLEVQHIAVSGQPGTPVRELRVKETEGSEAIVTFEGEPPLYGCFTIDTDRLQFPRTAPGMISSRRVRLTNTCAKDAAVTSAVISNGFYYYSTDSTGYPKMVGPRQTLEVVVNYDRPGEELGDQGLLTIGTNDARNPRFSVILNGNAALPKIQAFPAALDFGTVIFKNPQGPAQRSECASQSRDVQIFSVGAAPLTISRLEVESTGDQLFQVAGVTINGTPVANFNQPMNVAPDSEMRVSLQFYPTREVPVVHQTRLFIHHNAGNDPFEVVLRGNGAGDGATTDVFEQLEGPKVDILWVIDDSCSMYDEQARLIQNLSQFVGFADAQNADYQMAVTVTDSQSSNAGKFRRCFPHPAMIAHDYPDREDAFSCTFEVGTRGSGIEAGLGAAMRALERATNPALDPATNINAGFVRDDAKLSIVTMSDEEDQSLESNQVLRDYFWSVKGTHRKDRVKVHAIAGPVVEACQTGEFSAAPGLRYSWMTQQMGGIFFNICLLDWNPVLRQLGLETFQPLDEWDLSQAADPSSIAVTVDGIPVPRDATNGWNYNPAGNSVHFNGTEVPPPGAQIVIDYTGLCRP
ncbi:MAG: choice-of-anchor D domain-containing protein [Deltaproteobacteria bacterium]|nr:choice-of-anchor D domain-containing protein [Deltaproteobacteria bacterium]